MRSSKLYILVFGLLTMGCAGERPEPAGNQADLPGSPVADSLAGASPSATAVPEVEFRPASAALVYGANEMEIRGTLTHVAGPTPEKVWVWAYFINPDVSTTGSWSDQPIEIVQPFTEGATATILARGHFHWATNQSLPRTGYYARVRVSTLSADDARVPSSARNYRTEGAVKVATK